MNPSTCDHLAALRDPPRPDHAGGCPACLEVGDTWVHLRYCDTCASVGCCDDSKNRHARRHAEAHGHPVIHSLEPGDDWAWCLEDDRGVRTA